MDARYMFVQLLSREVQKVLAQEIFVFLLI